MNRLRIWLGAFAFLHTRLSAGLFSRLYGFAPQGCSDHKSIRAPLRVIDPVEHQDGSGRMRKHRFVAAHRSTVSPGAMVSSLPAPPLRGALGTSPWSVRAARNIGSGRVLRMACKGCCIPRWLRRLDEVARHERRTEQGASTGERQAVRGWHRTLDLTDPRP